MTTIQIVLDESLLRAVDREARSEKTNRSALIRIALREHLRRLGLRAREERDRRGYAAPAADSLEVWDRVQAWDD